MSDFAHHPDDETLRLFAVGRLTERQGDEIEKHLAGCETCTRRLDVIERKKNDSVLNAMKAAVRVEGDDPFDDEFSPGMKVGGFCLEERLGRGGMGEAWKAWDETAQRHVVLKFVPKDVQHVGETMNAVLDSFQKVHALQHSHICPLYMIDNDPEHGFFVVMKFIDGLPLNAYSRQHGPLSFEESVQILRDVADALDYAHSRKVVHRDVKPANIMVGSADGVQLIDFGLADEIRATLTRTENVSVQNVSGTRSYMAPEQWQGRKQDARTDQYALAVTAYELLAGHVPFSGDDTEVLKNAVLHDTPAPITGLAEHVNAALLRGLAKSREDRFENCRAFVEALEKPIKTKTVLWKWIMPALIVSVLILFVVAYSSTRQSSKPRVESNADDSVQNIGSETADALTIENAQKTSSEYAAMLAPGKRYVTDWLHNGESGRLAMQFDAYDTETDQMKGVFFDPDEPDKTYAFTGDFDKTLKSEAPVFLAFSFQDFLAKTPQRPLFSNANVTSANTRMVPDYAAMTPTQRFLAASMNPPALTPPLSDGEKINAWEQEQEKLTGTRLIKENDMFIRAKKSQDDKIGWRMRPLSEESYKKMRESSLTNVKTDDLLEKARTDQIKELVGYGKDCVAEWAMNGESGRLGMKISRFDEQRHTFGGWFYSPDFPNDPLYRREFSGTFSLSRSENEKPYSVRMGQKRIDSMKHRSGSGTLNDLFFPRNENDETVWKLGIVNGRLVFDEPGYDVGFGRLEHLKLVFEPAALSGTSWKNK